MAEEKLASFFCCSCLSEFSSLFLCCRPGELLRGCCARALCLRCQPLGHAGDCLSDEDKGTAPKFLIYHRSPYVCPLILALQRWTLEEALVYTRRMREVAKPNRGFMQQLAHYEGQLGLAKK